MALAPVRIATFIGPATEGGGLAYVLDPVWTPDKVLLLVTVGLWCMSGSIVATLCPFVIAVAIRAMREDALPPRLASLAIVPMLLTSLVDGVLCPCLALVTWRRFFAQWPPTDIALAMTGIVLASWVLASCWFTVIVVVRRPSIWDQTGTTSTGTAL